MTAVGQHFNFMTAVDSQHGSISITGQSGQESNLPTEHDDVKEDDDFA